MPYAISASVNPRAHHHRHRNPDDQFNERTFSDLVPLDCCAWENVREGRLHNEGLLPW